MLCVHSKLVFKCVTFTLQNVDNRQNPVENILKSTGTNNLIINTLTTIFITNVDNVEKKPIIL
jgi:hypothetical protein